jgi:acetoin utilization protein AcuC
MTILYDARFHAYTFGQGHPFSPQRQTMLIEAMDALGHPLRLTPPPVATRADVLSVHDEGFVAAVERAGRGEDVPVDDLWRYGLNTPDVPIFDDMDGAARALVGGTLCGALEAAETGRPVLMLGGGLHHARRAEASGFCVYSDHGVAIRALRERGLRVAYVDVDVHHGDGVEGLFYDDPDVLTISLHQDGHTLYPGTGAVEDLGEGAGRGYALNVPLLPETGDDAYLHAFETVVPHALAWFGPDVLLVEAGADAHRLDPLANLHLTTHAYRTLWRRLAELGAEHAGGRMLVTLGGGYHPDSAARVWLLLIAQLLGIGLPAAVPPDWRAHWSEVSHVPFSPTFDDPAPTTTEDWIADIARQRAAQVIERASRLWT